jgi:hypothetical protein
MGQVVTLYQTDAVFAGGGAFELDGALDHLVDEVFGGFVVFFAVVEDDRWGRVSNRDIRLRAWNVEQGMRKRRGRWGKERKDDLQWKFPSPT